MSCCSSKKNHHILIKLLLTAMYLGLVLLAYRLGFTCIFLRFFNFECAGCGMTRAYLSLLSFDFCSAFKCNFMFWSVPICYIYFLFDGHIFKRHTIDILILSLIGLGFAILSVARLFGYICI
jgi:hypothetical protein